MRVQLTVRGLFRLCAGFGAYRLLWGQRIASFGAGGKGTMLPLNTTRARCCRQQATAR
ncbi:protein of unknown function [Candidatus Promineifilum breve]|uniref:Uncharacterized protein n=1 Tax=Candidatus Promineifilum breve TaxID=1806508 RepID=A0A170PDJ5_9CHLR|nr:protein of unknown function [Candidatus Promineifilum breve]